MHLPTTGLTVILGLLANMGIVSFAFADDFEIVEIESKTWILNIKPGCDYEDSDDLRHRLNYNNTAFEPYTQDDYEVVCMGGVDILSIESVTLPLLRSVFPHDAFVFVYGDVQERDFRLYISTKYGPQYYRTADGNADIELGYAIARASAHADIEHERAHIETCSAHFEGADNNDAATWTRVGLKPWCP